VKHIGQRYDGGFQLLRELARGAQARVYLASDGSTVEAVKVHAVGDGARADREFLIGRDLDHPHLVTVTKRFDLGIAPAVAMRFVPGSRLGVWIARAPLERRLTAIDGLLAGLARLHQRGVVHRDVKPDNVLIVHEARPVLIDYDLATLIGDERDLRSTAGTVAYLSPEQASGLPAGPASDLYAVGILLYHALTGEVPFTGRLDEVLERHKSHQPTAPSSVAAGLEQYDEPIARLLAKRPADRYPSAEAARQAIRVARLGENRTERAG